MNELKVYSQCYDGTDGLFYLKSDVNKVIADKDREIAEIKQKLEDAQREVNNYRRHANKCEGLAAKGDIDKVSLLEEINDLKNDKELLDSQLYGFLQLEEEYGGGDLRNYIAELKAENESLKYSVATLDTDIAMMKMWRNVSDNMPTVDEGYFLVMWEDYCYDIGYIGAEEGVIETIRDRGEGHSIEWWMPLPELPKETK